MIIVTEHHRDENFLPGAVILPDITTRILVNNGVQYRSATEPSSVLGCEYSVVISPLSPGAEYLCEPSAPKGGWVLAPILDFSIACHIPNGILKIKPKPKGTLPSFVVTIANEFLRENYPSVASVALKFEGVTPMIVQIEFDVTSEFHKAAADELLPYGSPFPISIVSRWIDCSWERFKISENISVRGNNSCAEKLGEASVVSEIIQEHFECFGTLCSLKPSINPGRRRLKFELSNSAQYTQTIEVAL